MSFQNSVNRLMIIVVALTIGSCASIPTSGPITEVTISASGQGVQIAPEPPQKGMSASRVVEGYLQAMADPTGD